MPRADLIETKQYSENERLGIFWRHDEDTSQNTSRIRIYE